MRQQRPDDADLFGYVLRTTRRITQPAQAAVEVATEPAHKAAVEVAAEPAHKAAEEPAPATTSADEAPSPPRAPVTPATASVTAAPRSPEQLEADVAALLHGNAPLGIAYSGGVDSATLLAVAVRALGAENVVAILAVSPSLARREREAAHATATSIGARVVEIETHEAADPNYRANGPDRCFFCKDEMFRRIDDALVAQLGLAAVAYGENADDAKRPDRPGSRAAAKHRVLTPLASAGLTKAEVRALARHLNVPVADKPAAPCLASRIPHGSEVTPQKLSQVDLAEDVLLAHGFRDGRVRHHGEIARIELPTAELARAMEPGVRETLLAGVRAAGFRFVTIDLAGIQSGAFTAAAMGLNK